MHESGTIAKKNVKVFFASDTLKNSSQQSKQGRRQVKKEQTKS